MLVLAIDDSTPESYIRDVNKALDVIVEQVNEFGWDEEAICTYMRIYLKR